MQEIIDLTVWQAAIAYAFVLIVLLIMKIRKIDKKKEIVVSSLRMMLQLFLIGHILVKIFENPNPFITIAIILLMEAFAVYTIFKKFKGKIKKPFKIIIAVSMPVGTIFSLLFFLFVVARISPWYSPQYFIPIAGMLIGNSMTGLSLGIKTFLEGMTSQKALVEEALILGATSQKASKSIVDSAFDAAIMPTVNSMVGMGIVFLPGMMTGQILSGISPITAIAYQIAIMLSILGSVAFTVLIMLQFGCRTFFNKNSQLQS